MKNQYHTIIVGGGLAGLSCACKLTAAGKSVLLLEATDRVGGRVRSDVIDGFTLDHGFQVLLTAYPACRELLDYSALRLRPFDPGALVRRSGKLHPLSDPWRKPFQAFRTAISPVGTFSDKLRIAKLRSASRRGTLADLYSRPHQSTLQRLQEDGFSPQMIDQFFRPFLGGVFLDESLSMSSRMLEFVFRMFASGDVALPADGMGAIPRQLSERLPRGTVRLQATVGELSDRSIKLTCGQELQADNVVVATESSAAARLLGEESVNTEWNSATTVYYEAPQAPSHSKQLILRGDDDGPVQSTVVLSNVAPEYASTGKSLISVSVSDSDRETETEKLDEAIRRQLETWFGESVSSWRRLQVFRIPYGLPNLSLDVVAQKVDTADLRTVDGVYVCGDHRETPSIQGAMNSGLRTADAIL